MENIALLKLIPGVVVASIVGAVVSKAILHAWPRKGKLGINLNEVKCPRCGELAPKIRKPANLRQTLWGGLTCEQCGCEFDKYGKQINT